MDLCMKHQFCALIAGPSSCGKTYFVSRLQAHKARMFDVDFQSVSFYDTLKDVKLVEGLPNLKEFSHSDSPSLIIIDDLMKEADGRVVDLFTRGSHHRYLSEIHITQNLFHQGKGAQDISLNHHYIVYFKNPQDRSQIFHHSRKPHPEKLKFIHQSYKDELKNRTVISV
ncbi:hypothetical protein J437_LFUL018211 [Ladona fulva]|uniref:Uncharacterized protein n=1 Tax=Ladona fulva TaxID=123851 RepID=A0A8K0KNF6_LADFU|nr:hypothetical protein J437_LFUL018211 [Ladona fulva]